MSDIQAQVPVRLPQYQQQLDVIAMAGNIDVALSGIPTSCESYGASPTATAAINTTAIQTALNLGGWVTLSAPGIYQYDATLMIPSETEFRGDRGVVLQAVTGGLGGANTFAAFQNVNANSTPINISSITATAYGHYLVQISVNFASAHGIVAGGYAQIKGDGMDIYNGIWKVFSVPTATSLTFLMSIAGGSTNPPPSMPVAVASISQTVAAPGVFTTATNSFVKGQAVTLTNAPTGFANGTIYYVIATGLTTTALELAASPFATSGIAISASNAACVIAPHVVGALADGNIKIGGGFTINQQFAAGGFTASGTYADHAINLRRVLNPVVDDVDFYDVRKYCVMMQDVYGARASNYYAQTGSDGVHIYGPAVSPLIENCSGTFGDDAAVFQNVDGSTYLTYMFGTGFDCGGDIFNGVMRNIKIRHTHNTGAAALYPQGNNGGAGATAVIYRMRGKFLVDGASVEDPGSLNGANWTGWYAVGLGNGYVPVSATLDSLELRGIYGPIRIDNFGGAVITIKTLQIDGSSSDSFFNDTCQTTLDYVTIDQILFKGVNYNTTGGALANAQSANTTINSLTFMGCDFNCISGSSGQAVGGGGATMGTITAIGCNFGPQTQLASIGAGSFANVPTINIIGGYGAGNKNLIEASGAANFNLNITQYTSNNPSVGVFNIYSATGTIGINVSALNYSGTLFANLSGTINFTNPDGTCPVDLSKVARKAGATAVSSAGNGTIVAGNLAVCDATNTTNSWKQISNTTLVY